MSRVVVLHGGYGCETGCCGHYVEVDGVERRDSFTFSHPFSDTVQEWQGGKLVSRYVLSDEAKREFAREFITDTLGAEHVADLDWENSRIIDD